MISRLVMQSWPPRLPDPRTNPPEPRLTWEQLRQAVEDECVRRWRDLNALARSRSDPELVRALDSFQSAWQDRDEVHAGRNPFA
jgi:hypothetical protein